MLKLSEMDLLKQIKTKTYTLDQGYMIDIVTDCKNFNAWIYHISYGVKMHIIGMSKKDISYENFLDLLQYDLENDIKMYTEEYMDWEG